MAHWWGWGLGAGLVFGLSLSVASTVVLLRALETAQRSQSPDGRIAIGWLIVEDLAMVLALVLLPVLADSLGGASPARRPRPRLPTAVAGLRPDARQGGLVRRARAGRGHAVVPWLLTQVARTGSRELFTLAVLATALGIALGPRRCSASRSRSARSSPA
jgi:monovalent cation:H+ antiporter-2, CPA2 family